VQHGWNAPIPSLPTPHVYHAQVEVEVGGSKKLEHTGVKVEFIGLIGVDINLLPCRSCCKMHIAFPGITQLSILLTTLFGQYVRSRFSELLQDRSSTYEFTSLVYIALSLGAMRWLLVVLPGTLISAWLLICTQVRELEAPGDLQGSKVYPFEFNDVEKQFESYDGINVRLRWVRSLCLPACAKVLLLMQHGFVYFTGISCV
jgi:hypothetical protein